MGIRYYAYPVPAELGDMAGDPADERPRMLYLDKCWGYLQRLFAPSELRSQPAYELVRGDVTHTNMGWIPFVRYLTKDEVSVIAADLADAAASECFVMDGVSAMRRSGYARGEFEEELDYVQQHLRNAARFTAELAKAGEGLVYVIG